MKTRLQGFLESSPFPILLVSLVGIVLLTVFGPALVVGDTWLTLMAGREVVQNGLPETETLTVLGSGATWTDQQWLAQVLFYGAHELAGMRAVVVLDVLLVVLALGLTAAAARAGGASSRSTFLSAFLPSSPDRGAGRFAPRRPRSRSSPGCSGCCSTPRGVVCGAGRSWCSPRSSSGRTSTARSSSARV